MLPIFDGLRDVTLASVTTRMLLAVLCGGLIGIERAYKRRPAGFLSLIHIPPAGFRTHILICLGAAITTLTSQFLYLNLHYYTDMARLGAQVVAGIGFIGAGTIVVTRQHRVKGLTTAAGLWASAIIGLALGGGFYEGALLTTVLVLVAESFLSRLEYRILDHVPEINLYMEYTGKPCLEEVLRFLRENKVSLQDMEITRNSDSESHNACAIFSLRFSKGVSVDELLTHVSQIEGVITVQEL